MTYTLEINYKNKKEYWPLNSAWAATHIAIGFLNTNKNVEKVVLVNNDELKIEKTFIRG